MFPTIRKTVQIARVLRNVETTPALKLTPTMMLHQEWANGRGLLFIIFQKTSEF